MPVQLLMDVADIEMVEGRIYRLGMKAPKPSKARRQSARLSHLRRPRIGSERTLSVLSVPRSQVDGRLRPP